MSLQKYHDEDSIFSDFEYEDPEDISHRKKIKRQLEEKLEMKRLQEELEDEFDWE